ncbi:MAG TPA: uroporphyrinogen decarboxylase family protein [Burkholderiales bacterium]|nr:uroporphyrinogen decarboxylase family protein [Burkholderiales bacterium]
MNNRERFFAAIDGGDVDRPPCTVWVHFASDAVPGAEAARRHAQFVRSYGWDMCKVMHDYRYPLPAGMETIERAADMLRFEKLPAAELPNYREQLALIRSLRAEFGPDMPIVDTFFDPFQQVIRKAGFGTAQLIYAHEREALAMLDAVTSTVCGYFAELKRAGCDAVLYSINGAITPAGERGVDERTFRTFLRPFDLRALQAMEGMARILHVHGTHVDMRRVLDYPCEAYSVSDRLPGNPSLAELRALTDKCLIGGINEAKLHERSIPELREEIRDAYRQAGKRRFMLAPGCTSAPQTPEHILRCVRETSLALA